MTTYAYARCSTDAQSTDSQLLALAKAGVDGKHIATDEATSGTVPWAERPGVQTLLSAVQPGDTVLVYSLSRAGRSTLDVLGLLQELERRGVTFRSLTESFDSSTPMGRMMITVMAGFAQLERDMTAERTKAGLAAARARGVKLGRQEIPGRRDVVAAGLAAGKRPAAIAKETGIPLRTVVRMMKRLGAKEGKAA